MGQVSYESGPDAALPSRALGGDLQALGLRMRRFKTGTPCRVHRRSIDFDAMERQDGDAEIVPFSFASDAAKMHNQVSCYITYTNSETHRIIRENLHRSPLFSGQIEGIGPRYCPSIETKIVRFADKPRHQLFVEPMGLQTEEYYLQGMSSSLPEDVQLAFLRTIRDWSTWRLCALPTPSSTTASTPQSCVPRWSVRKSPVCTAPDSSTAAPAMRRLRRRDW